MVIGKCRFQGNVRWLIDLVGNKKMISFIDIALGKPVPVVPHLLDISFLLPGDKYLSVITGKHFFYLVGGKNGIITKSVLKINKLQSVSIYYENTYKKETKQV